MSFSNAGKWKVKVKSLSRVLATPWTTAYQAPPSMGFSRQEYWSRLPLPSLRTIYTHMQISVYKMWNLSRIVPKPVPCGLTELQICKRSLVGYNPWSRKESDMTEQLSAHTQDWKKSDEAYPESSVLFLRTACESAIKVLRILLKRKVNLWIVPSVYTHKHIKSLRASKEKEKKTYTSIKINRNYSEQRMKIYCAFNILHGYCCHCYYYFYKCCHEFNILNWHLLSCLILFLQMYS